MELLDERPSGEHYRFDKELSAAEKKKFTPVDKDIIRVRAARLSRVIDYALKQLNDVIRPFETF